MTSIGGDGQIANLVTKLASSRWAVGDRIRAEIIGQNRQGISVRIGRETFQLEAQQNFADTKTVTLQRTGASSASGVPVKVVATDGQPLSRDIPANLTAGPRPPALVANTILEANPIRVAAQPLDAEGKAEGPRITLQLQAPSGFQVQPDDGVLDLVKQVPSEAAKSASAPGNDIADRPSSITHRGEHPGASPGRQQPVSVPQSETERGQRPPLKSIEAATVQDVRSRTSSLSQPTLSNSFASSPTPASLSTTSSSASPPPSALGPTPPAPPSTSMSSTQATTAPPTIASVTNQTGTMPASPASTSLHDVINDIRPQQGHGPVALPQDGSLSPTRPEGGQAVVVKSTPEQAASTYRFAAAATFGAITDGDKASLTSSSGERPGSSALLEPTTAVAVGRLADGKVVLEAKGQLLRVEQPIDLPIGATLQASLAAGGTVLPSDTLSDQPEVTPITRLIELLDDIDRASRQRVDVDQPDPPRQLPAPDKHLASRFLGLMASADMTLLEDGQPSFSEMKSMQGVQKEQIHALMRELGQATSESLADGWRGLTLPLGADQNHAVAFYFRDHRFDPDDETAKEEVDFKNAQRAVFDISFSRLGRCQIDALCQENKFDLLIRSETPFSPNDQNHITTLFLSASEIAGVHGEVAFKLGGFFEPERAKTMAQDLRT